MPENKIDVKMGEFIVGESPTILQSIGIGSCVVVCIYDSKNKVGGLAHIMSAKSKMKKQVKPMRFADTSISMMIEALKNLGGNPAYFKAKIAGGASMFKKVTHILAVGNENIIAVRNNLMKHKIKIVSEDIGGNSGRSVHFDLSSGDVVVTRIKGETKVI